LSSAENGLAGFAHSRPGGPEVVCTGIAVLDAVFRVAQFPVPEAKTQASAFMFVSGGCAANAAVAITRLGGRARFAGPLGGPAGQEAIGDRIMAALAAEQVDTAWCPRVAGVASSMSAICVDPRGERAIVNYRDDRLAAARPSDPSTIVATADAVLADNRFPEFVLPICKAARARGLPVVLRCRQADAGDRHSAPARIARGLFHRGAARHRRDARSRRRLRANSSSHWFLPGGDRWSQ
jgi:sulfofructose kinase